MGALWSEEVSARPVLPNAVQQELVQVGSLRSQATKVVPQPFHAGRSTKFSTVPKWAKDEYKVLRQDWTYRTCAPRPSAWVSKNAT